MAVLLVSACQTNEPTSDKYCQIIGQKNQTIIMTNEIDLWPGKDVDQRQKTKQNKCMIDFGAVLDQLKWSWTQS